MMKRGLLLLALVTGLSQAPAQSAAQGQMVGTRQGLILLSGSMNLKSCVKTVTTAMQRLNYRVAEIEPGVNGYTANVSAQTPRKLMVNVVCNKADTDIFMSIFGVGAGAADVGQTLEDLGAQIDALIAVGK